MFVMQFPFLSLLAVLLISMAVSGLAASLPSNFKWTSSGPLISAKSDSTHQIVAVKDPSVVYYNGRWHVFATTASRTGWQLVYVSFTDWSNAAAAQHIYLDQTPIGGGYKCAPQVFFFAPQALWYLIWQNGANAGYSTNKDVGNPWGWSTPRNFYASGMPAIVRQNIGSGSWLDFWCICDTTRCHMFSSDDNGHLYRSETTLANFPNGFDSKTVIVLSDTNKFRLWEAANVYKVSYTNTYLLLVEAIGSTGRYFRSWTSTSIEGYWTPLADTEANPFARQTNVVFPNGTWSADFSHGEMIRAGIDQTLTINPCRLQFLYQGLNPASRSLAYDAQPWQLGLLTQSNSNC